MLEGLYASLEEHDLALADEWNTSELISADRKVMYDDYKYTLDPET
jgi:hypothetical protein